MQVEGCEKLTKANIIIAYELSSENPKAKTKFHDELYGRNKDGFLFKIPHRKLANGVIEIPQRNLADIRPIFRKYGVRYHLRISIPESDPEKIIRIAASIKDPYEKALDYDSLGFSTFIVDKLDKIGKQELAKEEVQDDALAISDTVGKWFKTHQNEPLSTGFAYMFKALEVADGKSPETIKREVLRISESLKHWIIGYSVLKDSKDTETIDEVLQKYKAQKQQG
jgi:hypothetical protein